MIKIDDLICPPGVAPKVGQVSQKPTGAKNWSKAPVKDSPDLERVLALDRRPIPTDSQLDTIAKKMTEYLTLDRSGLGDCRCSAIRPNVENPCLDTLRHAQAWALLELHLFDGILGSIGVGHGKTLLGILAAMVANDCEIALILVPPRLVKQLLVEYELAGEHFKVPSIVVHDGTNATKIIPGRPVLHVMPYSRLSLEHASDFIDRLNPDLLIVDEFHSIKNREASRAARVLRRVQKAPDMKNADWTGTPTDRSLKDYGHIAAMTLKHGSPLPLDPDTLADWAGAIDAGKFPSPAGALFAFCEPGQDIRKGFADRLLETPGVISTRKAPIDARLTISEREAPPIPTVVSDAMESIRNWERPDGEDLDDVTDVARCIRQASCGFYYRWIYPRGEKESVIDRWFAVRKAWHQELREKLKPMEEFLDSPLLCQRAAERFMSLKPDPNLPTWDSDMWAEWREVKDTVYHETETIWLDTWLAEDAAEWALANKGIVWYGFGALGEKIAEISGLPLHGGGIGSDDKIQSETGDRSIVASIAAHGTGTDGLQRLFTEQLIIGPPSSSKAWEQLLGRLHRIGQSSDHVKALVYLHTPEFRAAIEEALGRALYVQDTWKTDQKLQIGFTMSE